jgi:hypothetical protein
VGPVSVDPNQHARLLLYVADALDAIYSASADNGGSYTCSEANRIAELFELVGHDGHEGFLLNHGQGDDDPNDMHRVCQQCRETFAVEHDMCGPCLHDARRSGWEPGTED